MMKHTTEECYVVAFLAVKCLFGCLKKKLNYLFICIVVLSISINEHKRLTGLNEKSAEGAKFFI